MLKILVTLPLDEKQKSFLESHAPQAVFTYPEPGCADAGDVREAGIIIGNVPPAMLAGASHLSWMQLYSAGTEGYVSALAGTGTILTNASGAYGLAISEHMVGMTLCLMKKLHLYLDNQHQSLWKDEGAVTSLYGAKVLVIGLGDIGGEFAVRCSAMGSSIIGIRRVIREKPAGIDGLYQLHQLDEVLPAADVVALCIPASKETYHLFDATRLEKMKKGAILLNVSRGTAIDQDALCDALESGHLGGAGLDVTDPEPLPKDHRLWKAPNLILTPHVSGGFHLMETKERILRLCAQNLRNFLSGKPLSSIVDFSTGYRQTTNPLSNQNKDI
jgi:phosphoglycerate dehydrogenase-like enzyme